MQSTYPRLNRQDYRTLGLAALGGALEFYDFIVFVFFTAILSKLFFPPAMPEWLSLLQTYGIFAAGYLARPLGGIVIAHFGDKLGRKRMFTFSLLLMALPTLCMGLLPTYASIGIAAPLLLLFLRILQGAAIGGEVPGAWVFVSEHVPPKRVGIAVGSLTAGLTTGILLGSLVTNILMHQLSAANMDAYGWRLAFILGGVFGLFSVYLRGYLEETPIFKAMHAEKKLAQEIPLKLILREHFAAVLSNAMLTWVLTAAIVVVILITPTYLQKVFAISRYDAMLANAVAISCLTLGCLVFGALVDKIGAKYTLLLGCMGLLLANLAFYLQLSQGIALSNLIFWYALAGFFVGVVGAIPAVLVRAFPPALRFSGLSFSYNVAYAIFGAFTPIWLSLWLKIDILAPAYYVSALCILGMLMAWIINPNKNIN